MVCVYCDSTMRPLQVIGATQKSIDQHPHVQQADTRQSSTKQLSAHILRTRSSPASASREVAGWCAMHPTALPTATCPCNLCCLKSHTHSRPSKPAVTSSLLQASAATPVTQLSCAADCCFPGPLLRHTFLYQLFSTKRVRIVHLLLRPLRVYVGMCCKDSLEMRCVFCVQGRRGP